MTDDHKIVRLLDDLPPIRGLVPGRATAMALPDGEIIDVFGTQGALVSRRTKAEVFRLHDRWWYCGEVP